MQVQLLVSDSDVKSYKQIKDDLDGLRLLVEKSELWVYKAKSSSEEKGSSKAENKTKEDDDEVIKDNNNTLISKKEPLAITNSTGSTSSDKQGSAIDLDIGPPLEPQQTRNYKTIQQVRQKNGYLKSRVWQPSLMAEKCYYFRFSFE